MSKRREYNDFALVCARKLSKNYKSVEALKRDLEYYGLPSSLARFNARKMDKDGYVRNTYESWSVYAFRGKEAV